MMDKYARRKGDFPRVSEKRRRMHLKKMFALLLCVILLLSLVSAAAFAQETGGDEGEIVPLNEPRTGACGDNATWTLDDYGNLVISGTGAIDDDAFYDFEYTTDVTSVTIESGVTGIGDYAFVNCSALKSVSIPSSVTSIGENAFSGCSALESVTIPGSVASIGDFAFEMCDNLESVTIEAGVESIGSEAFGYCYALVNLMIGAGVTNIGVDAFVDCTSLASVTLPEGVTSIGNEAFYGCTALETVTLPKSLTDIGKSAFADCDALSTVNYGGTEFRKNALIGYRWSDDGNDALYDAEWNFADLGEGIADFGTCGAEGDNLIWTMYEDGSLVISGSGDMADYYNVSTPWEDYTDYLVSLELPEGLTYIGADAFYCCYALESLTIPSTVTSIGKRAFYGCSSLDSLTIPANVTSIGLGCFGECTSLASVTIPSNVTSIGADAFIECYNLTTVTIEEGVTSIGNAAFSGCTELATVTLPKSLTSIGDRAFDYCESLTNVNYGGTEGRKTALIGNGWSNADNDALYDADWICVDLGEGVVDCGTCGDDLTWTLNEDGSLVISGTGAIDDAAFQDFFYADSVTSVTIEEGVTGIGAEAFSGCTQLETVTIPVSVTSIGAGAFAGCECLSDVYYGGTEEQMAELIASLTEDGDNDELLDTAVTWHSAEWQSEKYTGKGWKTNFVDTVYLNAQDTTYLNIVAYVNTGYSDGDLVSANTGKFVLNFGNLQNVEIPLTAFDDTYDETDVESKVALAQTGYYAYADSNFYTIRVRVYPNHMGDQATIRLYDGDTQVTLYRNTGGAVFGAASWGSAGYELWSLQDGFSITTYAYLRTLQSSSVFGDFATKMIAYGEAASRIEQWN